MKGGLDSVDTTTLAGLGLSTVSSPSLRAVPPVPPGDGLATNNDGPAADTIPGDAADPRR